MRQLEVRLVALIDDLSGNVVLQTLHGTVVARSSLRRMAVAIGENPVNCRWWKCVKRMVANANNQFRKACLTPWEIKAATWRTCSELRGKELNRPRSAKGRLPTDPYKSNTWKEAVARMWTQADGRSFRANASPWNKWAASVSRNQIRRYEARHAGK